MKNKYGLNEKIDNLICFIMPCVLFIAGIFIGAMVAALTATADDRTDCARSSELSDTSYSDRIALAQKNKDYTPAIQPDVSRDLTILQDRNARDRSYFPDERWTEGRNYEVVCAVSDKPIPTTSELRELILRDAVLKAPNLIEDKVNAYPNTFLWYMWKDFDSQCIFDASETLKVILKISQ